ncbi:MAG: amino acid adenylation domain-containing protein, partial [Bacteroidota bacterium]
MLANKKFTFSGKKYVKHLNFWKEHLGQNSDSFVLPGNRKNGNVVKEEQMVFALDNVCRELLHRYTDRRPFERFVIWTSVISYVLSRYTGEQKINILTPLLKAKVEREMWEKMVPITLDLSSPKTIKQHIIDTDRSLKAFYQFQNFPLDLVTEENHHGMAMDDFSNVIISHDSLHDSVPEDLKRPGFFHLAFGNEEAFEIHFDANCYLPSFVHQFGEGLKKVLQDYRELNQQFNKIAILSKAEAQELMFDLNDTSVDHALDQGIVALFQEQATQNPDKTALIFKGRQTTYQQLDVQSDALANYLIASYDVQPDDLIGIMMERSDWAILAILGILKSGAAYVPIDQDYPQARKQFILEDTKVKALLTQSVHLLDENEQSTPVIAIDRQMPSILASDAWNKKVSVSRDKDKLAYVIYTSGSTGRPKGVMIQNDSLRNYLSFCQTHYRSDLNHFSFPFFTSLSFDLTQTSIFLTLLTGGTLVIENSKEIDVAFENISNHPFVNAIKLTPAHTHFIPSTQKTNIKVAILGGEQLDHQHVKCVKQLNPSIRIFNEYGPTEATIGCVVSEVKDDTAPIRIGQPIDNTQVYILNESGGLVPKGVIGELCIGGAGLARGYLNRHGLTKQKFFDNPFCKKEGAKFYRTGDLARWCADGNIAYIGRKDSQVKIRGYRVEIGEIENAISACPEIKENVVLTKSNRNGALSLIAYVVAQHQFDRTILIEQLEKVVPSYMIPNQWVEMKTMPLTINGKIDRKALKAIDITAYSSTPHQAAETATEQTMIKMWETLLETNRIGRQHDFFEAGGHSLAVNRLIAMIYKKFRVKVSFTEVFEHSKIATLANLIDHKKPENYQPIPPALPDETTGGYPLSDMQKQIWFTEQQQEEKIGFIMPTYCRFSGHLNIACFQNAFQQIIDRHESLRTTVQTFNGEPQQLISSKWSTSDWFCFEDLRMHQDAEEKAIQAIRQEIRTSFDLENGPLIKVGLFQIASEEYLFLLKMHHIISDGSSMDILFDELIKRYNAIIDQTLFQAIPLNTQYKDFASWQLTNTADVKHKTYWLQEFANGIPRLELNPDFVRPPINSFRGAGVNLSFDEKDTRQLKEFCQRHGVSLYMLFSSMLNVLLYKYTGQKDLVIGSPFSGRTHIDLVPQVGVYVNLLAFRHQLKEEETYHDFLKQVRQKTLAGYTHQSYPFNTLVKELAITRSANRGPLFDIYLDVQVDGKKMLQQEDFKGFHTRPITIDYDKCNYDLEFVFNQFEDHLQGQITYSPDLFRQERILAIKEHFQYLVDQLLDQEGKLMRTSIKEIAYMPEEEKRKILIDFNENREKRNIDQTVLELMAEKVERTPHKTAVVANGERFSYQQIDQRSNQLAHHLIQQYQIKKGDLVAVFCENSIDFIIAILGILKCGGGYIPFDVETSSNQRFQTIIESHPIATIITQASLTSDLEFYHGNILCIDRETAIEDCPTHQPAIDVSIHDLAYIIFTSGSTGVPKGVMIEHRNLVNMISNTYGIGEEDGHRVLLTGSLSFDASVFDIWRTLAKGHTLYLFPKKYLKETGVLKKEILANQIDFLFLTTPWFNFLVDADPDLFYSLKTIVTGGDLVSPQHMKRLRKACPELKIIHGYGPAENTTYATLHLVKEVENNIVPIGKAWDNQEAYLLNANLDLVPAGSVGEICLSGESLARGYLGDAKLTDEKFCPHPFQPGKRMYRTGDLGYHLPNGDIVFAGRVDKQLKINGYRVETSEVMGILKKHQEIKDVYVYPFASSKNQKKLRGVIVAEDKTHQKADLINETRKFAYSAMPDYMVPVDLMVLDALPLTVNGKVDVAKMNHLFQSEQKKMKKHLATTIQEKVAASIWEEVLGQECIGVKENFYDLGGDSIKAMQIAAQLHKAGFKIEVKDIYHYQNVEAIAQQMKQLKRVADQNPIVGSVPMGAIQKTFFAWNLKQPSHYNQSLLLKYDGKIEAASLREMLTVLQTQHDMLRAHFIRDEKSNEWQQIVRPVDLPINLEIVDLKGASDTTSEIEKICNQAQHELNLNHSLWKVVYMETDRACRIFMVAHHLLVDGVSWRVIIDDLSTLMKQKEKGQPFQLGLKFDSYKSWTEMVTDFANSFEFEQEMAYWNSVKTAAYSIPTEFNVSENYQKDEQVISVALDEKFTHHLLAKMHQVFEVEPQDVLLSALCAAIFKQFGKNKIAIMLEGHGREEISNAVDVNNTVGWFTAMYPVVLNYNPSLSLKGQINNIHNTLKEVPRKGLGYGILNFIRPGKQSKDQLEQQANISFNYLGQFDSDFSKGILKEAPESRGKSIGDQNIRKCDLDIGVIVFDNKVHIHLAFNSNHFYEETMQSLINKYRQSIEDCINQ